MSDNYRRNKFPSNPTMKEILKPPAYAEDVVSQSANLNPRQPKRSIFVGAGE
jgi:hypothetical protein